MLALPDHRHRHAFDPGGMLAGEGGRCQHLVGRIDMHVILLRGIGKIGDTLHQRIVGARNVHAIVDDVARVGHPLAADDELVFDALAEGIARAAVIAGDTDAAFDGRGEILYLFLLDLRHRHDRNDQRQVVDRRIGEGFGRVFQIDLEPVLLQHVADDMGAFLRLVPAPAAPDDQCLAHSHSSSN